LCLLNGNVNDKVHIVLPQWQERLHDVRLYSAQQNRRQRAKHNGPYTLGNRAQLSENNCAAISEEQSKKLRQQVVTLLTIEWDQTTQKSSLSLS